MPILEINTIIAYMFGLILLFLLGWVLVVPLKIVLKLIYNGVLGGIILILINFVGNFFGFYIGVNPVTAIIAGLLGIPGIILLVLLKSIFKI